MCRFLASHVATVFLGRLERYTRRITPRSQFTENLFQATARWSFNRIEGCRLYLVVRRQGSIAFLLLFAIGLLLILLTFGSRHRLLYVLAYRVVELLPIQVGMNFLHPIYERLDSQLRVALSDGFRHPSSSR